MTHLTNIKVSAATRDELKAFAERDGLTLDEALGRLLKSERQRRIGADLAAQLHAEKMHKSKVVAPLR
jgi:hypothetical protein